VWRSASLSGNLIYDSGHHSFSEYGFGCLGLSGLHSPILGMEVGFHSGDLIYDPGHHPLSDYGFGCLGLSPAFTLRLQVWWFVLSHGVLSVLAHSTPLTITTRAYLSSRAVAKLFIYIIDLSFPFQHNLSPLDITSVFVDASAYAIWTLTHPVPCRDQSQYPTTYVILRDLGPPTRISFC
jgi:hypothetical protein